MSETTGTRHGFFQSIQSVLPTHNPLHRHHDEEDTIAAGPASAAPRVQEPPVERTRKKGDLVSSADQLALFRSLVGIDNPPGLHASTFWRSGRIAPNLGIYARVVTAESKAARSYKIFSTFISFCIGAQVLVAATLTALGAGNGPRSAVTAFGAINTILAGFMAYFKGSGLPNRLKYYQNEWTKLREYIEQRERDFCRADCNLDLDAEILTIETMYEEVKGDIEANTPDSFVSVRDISKRGGAVNPAPSLAKGAGVVVDVAQEKLHDPAMRSVAGLKRNLSYQSSHFGDQAAAYGEKLSPTGDKVTGYAEKAMGYGEKAAAYGEKAAGYGEKAAGYAERVSHFMDRPHTVGLSIDSPRTEHAPARDAPLREGPPQETVPKEKSDADHMV